MLVTYRHQAAVPLERRAAVSLVMVRFTWRIRVFMRRARPTSAVIAWGWMMVRAGLLVHAIGLVCSSDPMAWMFSCASLVLGMAFAFERHEL